MLFKKTHSGGNDSRVKKYLKNLLKLGGGTEYTNAG